MLRSIFGTPQHYDWGDSVSIPLLLGLPLDGNTWAEMWFGTHHVAPSHLDKPNGPLLSSEVGEMTMLVKLLACAKPLSLQTHPTTQQASDGFAKENSASVSLDSPLRMYRDASDKPEMLIALTPFEALCGFQPIQQSVALLRAMNWQSEADVLETNGIKHYVNWAMQQSTPATTDALPEWLSAIASLHPHDPALRVAPLLHHVTLQPGEAISLPAGNLHAYIRGFGLEVMKSSDNVIRAGFTSKFVNVEELLSIVDFSSIDIPVIRPDSNGLYASPTPAFDVQQIPWKHGTNVPSSPVNRILFGPVADELMNGTPEMVLLPANEELELGDPDGSGGVLWIFTQN